MFKKSISLLTAPLIAVSIAGCGSGGGGDSSTEKPKENTNSSSSMQPVADEDKKSFIRDAIKYSLNPPLQHFDIFSTHGYARLHLVPRSMDSGMFEERPGQDKLHQRTAVGEAEISVHACSGDGTRTTTYDGSSHSGVVTGGFERYDYDNCAELGSLYRSGTLFEEVVLAENIDINLKWNFVAGQPGKFIEKTNYENFVDIEDTSNGASEHISKYRDHKTVDGEFLRTTIINDDSITTTLSTDKFNYTYRSAKVPKDTAITDNESIEFEDVIVAKIEHVEMRLEQSKELDSQNFLDSGLLYINTSFYLFDTKITAKTITPSLVEASFGFEERRPAEYDITVGDSVITVRNTTSTIRTYTLDDDGDGVIDFTFSE